MTTTTLVLLASAVSIGFLHTLLGPDHYVPFIAMSRAGGWSRRRTMVVTALCGVGHVAGSVVLGLIGIAFGLSLSSLEAFESSRGSWAAWGLIVFGLLYIVWGLRRSSRGHTHSHLHTHANGTTHRHEHDHQVGHLHAHPSTSVSLSAQGQEERAKSGMTPWVLFVIFLLGPCEALIPLLMFPAATESWGALFLVTGAFGFATLSTMLVLVFLGVEGTQRVRMPFSHRLGHVAAGLTVLLCGVAIQFLGL
jgi:ABC-type nickel/cobalt efflux system permease component RcnA